MNPLFPGRLAALPDSPFARLAALLDGLPHPDPVINLSVGDPKGAVPEFIAEAISAHTARFGEYPPIQGTDEWRAAAAAWLRRRFDLPETAIAESRHLLPLNGTREGLFLAPFIVTPTEKAGGRPVILLPNPFYQVYAGAILAAGAEPVFMPATAATGFLPDFTALPPQILARTVACYICSPSNPEGAIADAAYWRTLFRIADTYQFVVFADECYADIYWGDKPLGALSARYQQTGGFERLLTFHSLSKRSGLPGLRSGIVAGDPDLIAIFRAFRNYAGPQVPVPLMAASAAAWRDEAHVVTNRTRYAERFSAARRIFGNHARIPEAGFFLWLEVGDGEAAAVKLWQQAGIRVVPGGYMGRECVPGNQLSNPGHCFIRVALVSELSIVEAALGTLAEIVFTQGA